MRILIFISLLSVLVSCGGTDCCVPPPKQQKDLIKGADISFLPELEEDGIKFYNASGIEKDMLDILKESGVNTIRLRLWHTPESGQSTLSEVKALSQQIKAKGMNVWLSVHYSDTWADPGHQVKPAAWNAASFTDLADSVYKYTKKVMMEIDPDIIQIGNEINGGFLLPNGSTSNVPNFITLLNEGIRAVREVSSNTKIMVHVAGFDVAGWFYQQLKTNSVDYDLIGLSYYPIWHGKDMTVIRSIIDGLGTANGKEVVIAETAYPFTLGWEDDTNNIVGEAGQLVSGYSATPDGQRKFLLKIRELVNDSNHGIGFCYWGAEWVAFEGEVMNGSSWENQALFDFNNKAVPALEAFEDEE